MASDDTEEKDRSPQTVKEPENVHNESGTTEGQHNLGFVHDEHRRRVSIASDAIQADIDKQCKLSPSSHDNPIKSILVNGDGLRHTLDGDQKYNFHLKDVENMRKFAYETVEDHDVRNSWWFDLCTKCRRKETGAGWEPTFWSFLCPYPFCPTYRHVARCIALILIGILVWGVIYSIIGKDIAPGGQLFDIAVLCILAHFGGWLFRLINLPALVGMLAVGAVYQNVGLINIHGGYAEFVSILRRIALVMILTRAGLDLDPKALPRLFCTVLRMGLIPWTAECLLTMVLSHYFLGFPWIWGLLLGSIIAAVAPAVVVPCLFRIRNKGYGVSKGIPTLVIAVSGFDDAASVAAFGIIYGIMFSPNSLAFNLVMGPMSIFGGILYGVLWGFLARYVPEKEDPFAVPLRILMLLGGGLLAVLGSEAVGMGGAGPLGCITAAFMSIYVWSKQGWEIEDNPVATAYEIFWMIFEPILFGLTGTQIKLKEINYDTFGIAMGILITGVVVRIIITLITGIGASLNMKEKLFVAISWMAKASVQAALSPIPLDSLKHEKHKPEYRYAEIILMMCVLSIVLTAPLGAIVVSLSGTKLLKKTSVSPPEGWRRSHRPSLRDIQVNDDDDDDDGDDDDNSEDGKVLSKLPIDKVLPTVVITTQP